MWLFLRNKGNIIYPSHIAQVRTHWEIKPSQEPWDYCFLLWDTLIRQSTMHSETTTSVSDGGVEAGISSFVIDSALWFERCNRGASVIPFLMQLYISRLVTGPREASSQRPKNGQKTNRLKIWKCYRNDVFSNRHHCTSVHYFAISFD